MPVRDAARGLALAAIRAARVGSERYCPICEAPTRMLARGGTEMCLRCRSLERHRLMVLYLRRETGLLAGPARLLHLAPEPPVHRVLSAAPHLAYTTMDLEPGPLVDVTADARQLPFADGSFDAIVCSHVLEHIPGEDRALCEFARVLAPDGIALVQIPVDPQIASTYETDAPTPEDRRREYGQDDHVRVYGRDVADRLAGEFEVDAIDYAERFSAADRVRMGLVERTARRGADIYRLRRSSGSRRA